MVGAPVARSSDWEPAVRRSARRAAMSLSSASQVPPVSRRCGSPGCIPAGGRTGGHNDQTGKQ